MANKITGVATRPNANKSYKISGRHKANEFY